MQDIVRQIVDMDRKAREATEAVQLERVNSEREIAEKRVRMRAEYLEEARYQPLSEKNIFDMYVVTALYFYLVVNNGYM